MNIPTLIRPAAALACAAFLAMPAVAETAQGNGVIRSESRAVAGFTGIALDVPARLEVRQGAAEGVTVEADENLLPFIETTVDGASLEIRAKGYDTHLKPTSIRIVVQARRIEDLSIGGSGTITADSIKGERLKLDIGGSGGIDIRQVDAPLVKVAIGGSGDVRIAGAAKRLDVSVAGSGGVAAPSMLADDVDVSIAGSGAAKVAARSTLSVTIAGAGAVAYWGDPQVRRTVLGVGAVTRMGPLPR